MRVVLSYLLFAILFVMQPGPNAAADDWPHWRGPQRDNRWRETGILERFPDGGPAILWRTPLAGGYAGPAVANGRVYVTDYITKDDVKVANFERKEFSGIERVFCLDEQTGEEIWKHEYPVKYGISYPAGPRCTPTVDGELVYTLGAEGMLICFDAASGEVRWSKHLPAEYDTKTATWGYAAHPLIDGERIITLAGGDGSHTVALNKKTGEEIWRSGAATEQGYSPPSIIKAAGTRQLILVSPDFVRAVEPETGDELWSISYQATAGSIIMTPIRYEDYLYVAGYSDQSVLLKLAENQPGAEVVWRNKKRAAISPVNVQPYLEGNVLYGFDQSGILAALELPEGTRLWDTPRPVADRAVGSATAFIVRQADRYWMFTEDGELVIAQLSPKGFEELDRAKVIEPTNVAFGRDVVWSMPAFANRHAYIRNDKEIICVDLSTQGN